MLVHRWKSTVRQNSPKPSQSFVTPKTTTNGNIGIGMEILNPVGQLGGPNAIEWAQLPCEIGAISRKRVARAWLTTRTGRNRGSRSLDTVVSFFFPEELSFLYTIGRLQFCEDQEWNDATYKSARKICGLKPRRAYLDIASLSLRYEETSCTTSGCESFEYSIIIIENPKKSMRYKGTIHKSHVEKRLLIRAPPPAEPKS